MAIDVREHDGVRYTFDGSEWVPTRTHENQEYGFDGQNWQVLAAPEPAPEQGFVSRAFQDIGDFRRQAGAAFTDSFAADLQGIGYLAGSESADSAGDYLQEAAESIREPISERAKAGAAKQFIVETPDGGYGLGDAWSDPYAWSNLTASSMGSLASVIAGGGVTKLGATLGVRGAAKLMGKNADEYVKKGKLVNDKADEALGAFAYGVPTGLMGAGYAGRDTEVAILDMPQEILEQSPLYQETYPEFAAEFPPEQAAIETRQAVARILAVDAAEKGGMVNLALGTVAGKVLSDKLRNVSRDMTGTLALSEGLTEAAQGGSQKFIVNQAVQQVDPNQRLMEGVANAAVTEGLGGGIAGGALGFIGNKPVDLTQDPTPDFSDVDIELADEIAARMQTEPAAELPAPSFTVTPDGEVSDGNFTNYQPQIETDNVIYGTGPVAGNANTGMEGSFPRGAEPVRPEPPAQPEPLALEDNRPTDYFVRPDGVAGSEAEIEEFTEREARLDALNQVAPQPETPLIEDQNIIYGEGPVAQRGNADNAMEGEFQQGYSRFTPLEEIEITQQFTVEETGETVEVTERADKLFSKLDKRQGVLTKLLECVSQ